jgi:hypothetical protein
VAAIESGVTVLIEARKIILEFQGIIRGRALADLDAWLSRARTNLVPAFANRVSKDRAAIEAAIILPCPTDRLKARSASSSYQTQMYGRGNLDLIQSPRHGPRISGCFIEPVSEPLLHEKRQGWSCVRRLTVPPGCAATKRIYRFGVESNKELMMADEHSLSE